MLMMILNVYGHVIIICIGIPIIFGIVKSLREKRIESLLLTGLDKLKSDIDVINQIVAIQQKIGASNSSREEDLTLIGLVNLHVLECTNLHCPCKNEGLLYDAATSKSSERKGTFIKLPILVGYHKDKIFLNHFCKILYEDALKKFHNSSMLHISFSHFLFDTMKNVHAALVELNHGKKSKPTIQQQFLIYKFRYLIENDIKEEASNANDIFTQLTNICEFERLMIELQKSMERVCNNQIEFWTQISNQTPDLNILYEFSKKIYDGSKETEDIWNKLCQINSNYSKALNLYGNFLIEIKKNNQLGCDLLEK